MNDRLISAVLAYGERYRQEHLVDRYDPAKLTRNWWEALLFFFGRAFYQGRRDTISTVVFHAAVDVLEPAIAHTDGHTGDAQIVELEQALLTRIGKGHIGKGGDVHMITSTLRYVRRLPNANIVADSVEQIKAGAIGQHYSALQLAASPQTGIYQVGPKVASFYLRDLVALFGLDECVPTEVQYTLQPIDVWVRRLAIAAGVVSSGEPDELIRQAIVEFTSAHGRSPLQYNQGAWYLGYNAFDLLIELLEKP